MTFTLIIWNLKKWIKGISQNENQSDNSKLSKIDEYTNDNKSQILFSDSGNKISIINKLGETYEGELSNSKKHGNGIFRFKNADKYIGQWKEDKRTGKGVLFYTNGDKYEGDWKDDKIDGKGICFYKKWR